MATVEVPVNNGEGYRFPVVVPESGDEDTFHVVERNLCRACREDFLDWVDGSEYDRRDKADLPAIDKMVKILEYTADDMNDLAERLRDGPDERARD